MNCHLFDFFFNLRRFATCCCLHFQDEGIGSPREEEIEDVRRDALEIRQQLDKERKLRMILEEKLKKLSNSRDMLRQVSVLHTG